MKKIIACLALMFPVAAMAQIDAFNGFCNRGGQSVTVSGLSSTGKFQNVIPHCTVTVYLTGTTTKATIYADAASTPLANPFTADALTSLTPGKWIFYAANGQGYDVIGSGGDAPNTFPSPVVLGTDLIVKAGGGGSGLTFFSAGNDPPLFTTNVANPGTTPNLTFLPISQAAHTAYGNFTGAATSPIFAQYACTGLLTCPYDAGSNTWTLNVPSTSTLSVTSTNPIKVNGGNGPVASGTANISCDGCGVPALRMNPGEDATHVFVPFTACNFTVDNSSLLFPASGCNGPLGGQAYYYAGGIFNHNIDSQFVWSNPALPSWLPAGNVVSVHLIAYTSGLFGGAGPVTSCGGPVSCSQWGYPPSNSQASVNVVGATGANLSSITANADFSKSVYCGSCASAFTITDGLLINQVGLLVEFTGVTNPNPNNYLNLDWPLTYNAATKTEGVDSSYPRSVQPVLTSDLPSSNGSNRIVFTSDNTQTVLDSPCTGSGTWGTGYAACLDTNSGYLFMQNLQPTGGSGGFPFTLGSTSIAASSSNAAVNGLTVNGVALDSTGLSSLFLNQAGGYTTPAGGGTVGGSGTNGFLACWTASTTLANCFADYGITLANFFTFTKGIQVNSTGPSQMTFTYNATPLVPGGATDAVFGVDSSGNAVASESTAAASRICTAANGVCGSGSAITSLTGDVTATGPGAAASTIANNAVTTAKINNAAVTYAKMQNVSANSVLLGAGASGSGAPPAEITLGTNLSMSGTTLNATGGGSGSNTIDLTASPYYASCSATTTTTTASSGATTITVGSSTTFSANQGIMIIGAGTGGVNQGDYLGTVSSIPDSTHIIISPATGTSVTGALVQHDETAAIQTAWTALGAGTVTGLPTLPAGVCNVNGPLQDTSHANAVLKVPVRQTSPVTNVVVGLSGATLPAWNYQILTGYSTSAEVDNTTIIRTTRTAGNLIGGKNTSGAFSNFTFVNLYLNNLIFRAPANPSITMVNAGFITSLTGGTLSFDTMAGGDLSAPPIQPTSSNGMALVAPGVNNAAQSWIDKIQCNGYYTCVSWGEHMTIQQLASNANWTGIYFGSQSGGASGGHTGHIQRMLVQSSAYGLLSSGTASNIIIDNLQVEDNWTSSWATSAANHSFCNDSGNNLVGNVYNYLSTTGGYAQKNSCTGVLFNALGSFNANQVNGASVPASQGTVGTNSSGQIVAGAAAFISSITTTGTSGASTVSGGVLNVPQYQGALTLTTTGTSGAATLVGNTLNIPQYTGGGGGCPFQTFDTFQGVPGTSLGSHTDNCGNTWTQYANSGLDGTTTSVLEGNGFIDCGSSACNSSYYNGLTPSSADYSVWVNYQIRNGSGQATGGVYGRLNTAAATFYIVQNAGGTCFLEKSVAGSFTTLGSTVGCGWDLGSQHTMMLKMVGTTISGWVDGTQFTSVTDSAISAAGKAGVRTQTSAKPVAGTWGVN